MSVRFQENGQDDTEGELIARGAKLLGQQVWCWGRDILRPEGNWLLEVGFERIEPPANRKNCSSVYCLDLPQGRYVVLRGFGVFFGDHQRGGIFLPRFKFQPQFTTLTALESPPWSDMDLPKLDLPTPSQRTDCASLTLELIDWIQSYESNIVEALGVEYRQSTLANWNNGKRSVVPADEMARSWKSLGSSLAEDFQKSIPAFSPTPSQPPEATLKSS